jgi:predicted phosphodiesterase
MNPGSISIPKGGYKPSFMIYENRKFVIKTFDGENLFDISI